MAGVMETGEFLAHFGIKGQKWGVRRRRSAVGRSAPRSADSEVASAHLRTAKKVGVHALSNSDLQALNTRLSLEQNYAKLTNPQKKKSKNFIQRALDVGKATNDVINFMNSPAGKMATEGLRKARPDAQGDSKASSAAKFAVNVTAAAAASRAKKNRPDDPIEYEEVIQLVPESHWLPRGST